MRKLPEITQDEWKEARNDLGKAVEIYKRGQKDDETDEERMARIRRFRCGGY